MVNNPKQYFRPNRIQFTDGSVGYSLYPSGQHVLYGKVSTRNPEFYEYVGIIQGTGEATVYLLTPTGELKITNVSRVEAVEVITVP